MEYGIVDVREAHESCILALRDPINFETGHLGAKMCKSYDYFFLHMTLFPRLIVRLGISAASRRLLAPAVQSGLSVEANRSSLLWLSMWTTVPKEICMIWHLTLP
jgi:hypothetical protein